nr:unnamed protein product [Callosobruchus analis]
MKVSCATQVLSHTVASVISLMAFAGICYCFIRVVGVQGQKLTETAVGTAQVLKFYNGHSLYPTGGKRLRCVLSRSTEHFEFWTEARQSLRRMYYQGMFSYFV